MAVFYDTPGTMELKGSGIGSAVQETMRLIIGGVALVLIAIAVLIFRIQAQAKSCAHHSKGAGRVAVALGWLCLAGAVALLGYALTER
jgi:hypothetical protein